MKLKIKTEKIIGYSDWNDFVISVYGRPYNFQQQDDCQGRGTYSFSVPQDYEPDDFENDTVPEIVNGEERGVSFAAWLARDPKAPLKDGNMFVKLWWERNFYPNITMVIEDLYQRGKLEDGEYLILIDW
jgi:hypothetical protein